MSSNSSTLNNDSVVVVPEPESKGSLLAVYIVVAITGVLILLIIACCYRMRKASNASLGIAALDPPVDDAIPIEKLLAAFQLPGRVKGKKHVANGTHCAVFRAKYNDQDVALKTPLACILKRADSDETLHTFAAEIMLCSRLRHDNIIRFIGVVMKSSRDITLVTEFMENGNVATLLSLEDASKFKWLSAKKAPVSKLTWAIEVASALAYMHGIHQTHRGMKAKNVLLTSTYHVKLSDMGLTRDKEVELSLSNTHSRTAGNIAPELILHSAEYSEAADMYAFGAFLCELDTCKPPFSNLEAGSGGLDNKQIALLVGQGKMQPKFSYSCPDPILELATTCMDFRPAKRPTANKVVQDLKQIQASLT